MGKVAKHQPIKLWGSYLSTIFSIALVLFVLGLLMVLGYHSYIYTTDIIENILYSGVWIRYNAEKQKKGKGEAKDERSV